MQPAVDRTVGALFGFGDLNLSEVLGKKWCSSPLFWHCFPYRVLYKRMYVSGVRFFVYYGKILLLVSTLKPFSWGVNLSSEHILHSKSLVFS